MVADIHYNDEMLQRLVNNQLSSDKEQEITQHVELCEECLAKLELLSGKDVNWNNVRRLLHVPMMDTHFSADTYTENTEPTHEQRALEFLLPSERSNSLGRFGRYEIEEVLGRGGMGIVLKGFDPELNRYSAIKVLASELATSASARSRFSREAKSAAAVIHEHVIPIQTVNEERGLPYLVMPVIEGQSLQQRIAQQGPLELKEVLRIGMQIASGLAAAHDQGLVHRDIKPANILLENGVERVMITDFGLARAADDANMTQSGVISGTPQYMSPEQARGCSIDHRSDLFSLGSVLYAMFTGHSPFRAETTMGVLNRITNDDPRSVSSINSDVPLWMQSIIERLLEKKHEDRFQSATEVADLLGIWLKHLHQPDVVPPPAPTPTAISVNSRPPIARWLIGAAAGAFLFFAGIFIVLETNKGTLTIESPLDNVPVLIRRVKDGNVAKELTLEQGPNSTRIAAGEYEVEIKGSDFDLVVVDGKVTIAARGTGGAKLAKKPASPTNAFDPALGDLTQPLSNLPKEFVNSIGMKMILTKMTFPRIFSDSQPLDQNFPRAQQTVYAYISHSGITQSQWHAVMGTQLLERTPKVKQGTNNPVLNLTTEDALAFIKQLSEKEGRIYQPSLTHQEFRPPLVSTVPGVMNSNPIVPYDSSKGLGVMFYLKPDLSTPKASPLPGPVATYPLATPANPAPGVLVQPLSNPPKVFVNSIGMKMVLAAVTVPKIFTEFQPLDPNLPRAQQTVFSTRYAYISEFFVTRGQWEAIMGTQPRPVSPNPQQELFKPVLNVSKENAWNFTKRLSQKEGQKYQPSLTQTNFGPPSVTTVPGVKNSNPTVTYNYGRGFRVMFYLEPELSSTTKPSPLPDPVATKPERSKSSIELIQQLNAMAKNHSERTQDFVKSLPHQNTVALLNLVTKHIRNGKFHDAKDLLEQLVKMNPEHKVYPGLLKTMELLIKIEKPLIEIIAEFNQKYAKHSIGKDQPPLTEDELIASMDWGLSSQVSEKYGSWNITRMNEEASLMKIIRQRVLPVGWTIEVTTGTDLEQIQYWKIELHLKRADGSDFKHVIRDRAIRRIDPDDGRPIELPKLDKPDQDGQLLSVAISEFNKDYRLHPIGKDQPPLTEHEVLAAIWRTKWKRDDSPVTIEEFSQFQKITDTRTLPKGAKLEVLTGFQLNAMQESKAWSVRIVMPRSTKPGHTYAYSIRQRYIQSHKVEPNSISWGPVSENGLQAGVRLEPNNQQYVPGQKVIPQFFIRNKGNKELAITVPRVVVSGKAMIAADGTGVLISVESSQYFMSPSGLIGSTLPADAEHRVYGFPIYIGGPLRKNEFTLLAKPGQRVQAHFSLTNFAEPKAEKLKTGTVRFTLSDPVENEKASQSTLPFNPGIDFLLEHGLSKTREGQQKSNRLLGIITLRFANAEDLLVKINKEFLSHKARPPVNELKAGQDKFSIAVDGEKNRLIIFATESEKKLVMQVIEKWDVDSKKEPEEQAKAVRLTQMFVLKHASADDMIDKLANYMEEQATRFRKDRLSYDNLAVAVVPDKQGNSLLVSATEPGIKLVKELINKWDIAPEKNSEEQAKAVQLTQIFTLKHALAKDVIEKFANDREEHAGQSPKDRLIYDNLSVSEVPNKQGNRLLVSATEPGMKLVKELINKWDKAPVLIKIEVLLKQRPMNNGNATVVASREVVCFIGHSTLIGIPKLVQKNLRIELEPRMVPSTDKSIPQEISIKTTLSYIDEHKKNVKSVHPEIRMSSGRKGTIEIKLPNGDKRLILEITPSIIPESEINTSSPEKESSS